MLRVAPTIESTSGRPHGPNGLLELANRATFILSRIHQSGHHGVATAAATTTAATVSSTASTATAASIGSSCGSGYSIKTNGNRIASALAPEKTFPQRLMDILSDARSSDIITWLPHGNSFVILQPDRLIKEVLPKHHFPSAKYTSFTRRLNRW